jgi:hypothetical protein
MLVFFFEELVQLIFEKIKRNIIKQNKEIEQ